MKSRQSSYIISLLCCMVLGILPSCRSAKLSQAELRHRKGEYHEAATIYRRVYARSKPDERDLRAYVSYRMGECNRLINNVPRATSAYLNALRYEYPDSTLLLRLGQVHHQSGRYADAIRYYTEYLSSNPVDSLLAKNGIRGCELAIDWQSHPTLHRVERAELFNSRRSEYSPMLYGDSYDQLYFTSTRGTVHRDSLNGITGLRNSTLFVAKKDEHGVWQKPEELTDPVSSGFEEGTPSFSGDWKTMYYTYCAEDEVESRTSEIYISTRSGASWSKGQRAVIVKDSFTLLAHPAASPDGEYLYFVADAIGGYGGKDIFRARLLGANSFGPMENLGSEINTSGDELFPYMRDSVTLYFSSNGHAGLGGLDIFKATRDSLGKWAVTNMGTPINSSSDDFGITFAGSRESGFCSSNRGDARGWDHIYSFDYPTVTIFIEGYVSDVEEYLVEGAIIRMVGRDGLNLKTPVKADGTYRIEIERDISYVMMASAPGYLNQNIELKTDADERSETYYVDFYLSPIDRPVVVEQIFYDFDSAVLRPESKSALDALIKLLVDNPHVTIELGSHTDRRGSLRYNEDLSQRRAQSVVDYLIASGIASDRLTAKGYGKTVPKLITPKLAALHPFFPVDTILTEEFINTLPPEEQSTADQLNRRTEFQVTGLEYDVDQ